MISLLAQASEVVDPLTSWSTLLYSMGGVGLMVTLILTGRLRTKADYDGMVAAKDAVIEAYKTGWDIDRKSLMALQTSTRAQLERDQIVHTVIQEIRDVAAQQVDPKRVEQ